MYCSHDGHVVDPVPLLVAVSEKGKKKTLCLHVSAMKEDCEKKHLRMENGCGSSLWDVVVVVVVGVLIGPFVVVAIEFFLPCSHERNCLLKQRTMRMLVDCVLEEVWSEIPVASFWKV